LEDKIDRDFNKPEWDFFVTAIEEEAKRILIEVGSDTAPRTLVESCLEDLQALAPAQDELDDRTEEQVWTQVRERLLKAAYATRPYCVRCGTCCTTGSPTLYEEDMALFVEEIIKPDHVITVRKGEAAYSGVSDEVAPLEEEIIKIRESPGGRTCVFYESGGKECSIYDSRPQQCRSQECWNPENYEQIAGTPMLKRKAILETTGAFWDMIQQHEERCSYSEVGRTVARLAATKGQTVQQVMDLLRLDHKMRQFISERFRLDLQTMDFFLGRPLRETIVMFGLKVEEQPDGSFLLTPLDPEEGEQGRADMV